MKTTDIPKDECPACRHGLDAASSASGDRGPSEGDYSVCVYCGATLVFRADLTVREATQAELAVAPGQLILAAANLRARAVAGEPMKAREVRSEHERRPAVQTPRLDLRALARGQQCQVWLAGCRGKRNTETTVLAHIRRAHVAGMGQKPPDLCGVYACDHCHSIIDGRETLPGLTRLELDQTILFALLRTLAIVQKELDQ